MIHVGRAPIGGVVISMVEGRGFVNLRVLYRTNIFLQANNLAPWESHISCLGTHVAGGEVREAPWLGLKWGEIFPGLFFKWEKFSLVGQ